MRPAPRIWDEEAFWSGVERGRSERCWPWRGPRDGDGYGRFADRLGGHAAHRVAYALRHGYLSFGILRHTCGNRACCNPRHLVEADEAPWEPRFWKKVDERPGGCWEWTGARNAAGYGVLFVEGRVRYAHRLAFERYSGRRLRDPFAPLHHTCGNRRCVNPHHLEPWGQSNVGKLGEEDVEAIRERAAGEPQSRLAAEYGISRSMVSRIVNRTRWTWV